MTVSQLSWVFLALFAFLDAASELVKNRRLTHAQIIAYAITIAITVFVLTGDAS